MGVSECGGGIGDVGVAVEQDASRILSCHEAGVSEHHIFGAREGDCGMCGVVADGV